MSTGPAPSARGLSPGAAALAIGLLLAPLAVPPAGADYHERPGPPGETVVLDGSSGMIPLMGQIAAAFRQQAPNIRVELGKGLGTGARMRALSEGKIHAALNSHVLKPEEITRGGLQVHEIARAAVVFAVDAAIPVTALTGQQLCNVYAGRITNWRELGGPDRSIVVLSRPPQEVDSEVIREQISCFRDLKAAPHVKVMARAGDMARGLQAEPGTLGLTSRVVVDQSRGRLKALGLDGTVPTPDNVTSGRYPLIRHFFLVTRGEPGPAMARLLAFIRGEEGARVISRAGAVPVR
ncbi:MAG: substrate-binding domain-containing protein [Deltaproteobacteria bacterium]|nr:substrate-binding domain-containing protein [Deltaproteobacteria bacterium]